MKFKMKPCKILFIRKSLPDRFMSEGRLSKERQYYFFDIRVVNKIVELKYKGIIVRIIAL